VAPRSRSFIVDPLFTKQGWVGERIELLRRGV
jgi:hypothetical protein